MAQRRILSTHTGSLPRPPEVLKGLYARERGEVVDAVAFEDVVRAAVVDAVRRQVDAGIDVVGDGEMGKPSYATYVHDRLTGFGGAARAPMPMPRDLADFPVFAGSLLRESPLASIALPTCTGKVRYRDTGPVNRDVVRLLAAIEGVPHEDAFLTAASPGVVALFLPNAYYDTEDAYLDALAQAMRVEYETIASAGLLLQIDAPDLAMGRHLTFAGESLETFRAKVRRRIEVLNQATEAIPKERMRLHVCWGNYAGPHHKDVPLEDVLDLLVRARPAGLSIVAANPRHAHAWRIVERHGLPEEKVLIPGVVDPTTPFIEDPEVVADRLMRFARVLGPERVIAGTDCGFGTFAGMSLEPALVYAKLKALADGARLASRRFAETPAR